MPNSNYRISNIKYSSPQPGKIYLIDSNVWLMILRPPENLNPYEKSYVDFFDAIIRLAMDPECENKPRIFMNEVLFSEIYNAFMNVNWKAYSMNVSTTCTNLKAYRATNDFKKQLKSIKSDFEGYSEYLITDIFSVKNSLSVLLELPENTDYNDNLYYRLASENGMTIITNDGDFKYEGVEILTKHTNLLSLS